MSDLSAQLWQEVPGKSSLEEAEQFNDGLLVRYRGGGRKLIVLCD